MTQKTFRIFSLFTLSLAAVLIVVGFFINEQYNDLKSLLINIGSGMVTTFIFIVFYDQVNSREKKRLNTKYKRVALITLKNILVQHLEFLCCLSNEKFFNRKVNEKVDFDSFFTDEYYSIVDGINLGDFISFPWEKIIEGGHMLTIKGTDYVHMQNQDVLKQLEKMTYKYGSYIPAEIIEEYEKIAMSKYIRLEYFYNISREEFMKKNNESNYNKLMTSPWPMSGLLREHVQSILLILNQYNNNVLSEEKIHLIDIEYKIAWM